MEMRLSRLNENYSRNQSFFVCFTIVYLLNEGAREHCRLWLYWSLLLCIVFFLCIWGSVVYFTCLFYVLENTEQSSDRFRSLVKATWLSRSQTSVRKYTNTLTAKQCGCCLCSFKAVILVSLQYAILNCVDIFVCLEAILWFSFMLLRENFVITNSSWTKVNYQMGQLPQIKYSQFIFSHFYHSVYNS